MSGMGTREEKKYARPNSDAATWSVLGSEGGRRKVRTVEAGEKKRQFAREANGVLEDDSWKIDCESD